MKKLKETKGITLIALVVTIVVLLILAGVSINLILNNKGVIAKAKDAKEKYADVQKNEEKQFEEVSEWIKDASGDTSGDEVPIPEGFYYVGGTKDSGLVISDNENDKDQYKGQTTVGTDLQGNQFVWIPVKNIADYKRKAYLPNVATETMDATTNSEQIKEKSTEKNYFIEELPEDEKSSIEKNKGYYIGRYEAGDKESTEAKTLRTTSNIDHTVVVKAGQAPYNFTKQADAKSLAEGFSGKQGYTSVTSKLVSSYAWDTALAFIEKTNSDYGDYTDEGNYNDVEAFTYIDIEGNVKTKAKNSSGIIPTGQTIAVNNIYDMGGNADEWTTEICSSSYYPYTNRGGYYNYRASDGSAGLRRKRTVIFKMRMRMIQTDLELLYFYRKKVRLI